MLFTLKYRAIWPKAKLQIIMPPTILENIENSVLFSIISKLTQNLYNLETLHMLNYFNIYFNMFILLGGLSRLNKDKVIFQELLSQLNLDWLFYIPWQIFLNYDIFPSLLWTVGVQSWEVSMWKYKGQGFIIYWQIFDVFFDGLSLAIIAFNILLLLEIHLI